MKNNTSGADRIIRIILAIALGALYFTNTVTGTLGIILLVVGIVFLFTAFVGFCPIYKLLGISTNKKANSK